MSKRIYVLILLLALFLVQAAPAAAEPATPREIKAGGLWPHKADWVGQKAVILLPKLYASASYLLLYQQPGLALNGADQLFFARTLVGKALTIKGLYELAVSDGQAEYYWLLTRDGGGPVWVRDTAAGKLANLPFALDSELVAEQKQMADLAALAGTTVWINRNLAAPPQLSADVGHLAPLTIVSLTATGPFAEAYTLTLDNNGEPLVWTIKTTGSRTVYSTRHFYRYFSDSFYRQDPRTLYSHWSDELWLLIKEREIRTGWDKDMVRLSWGEPERMDKEIIGPDKGLEKWRYDGNRHLFFRGKELVKIKVPNPDAKPNTGKQVSHPQDKDAPVDDGLIEVPGATKETKQKESKQKEAD